MPTILRRLGVQGRNIPAKKSKTVTASDFSIGAVLGFFERKYKVAMPVANVTEELEKFGDYVNSAFYGKDVTKTFWDNLAGSQATLHIKSFCASDAVNAKATVKDALNVDTLEIDSAYKGVLDYGISGNRSGYVIVLGTRYATTLSSNVVALDTVLSLTSVIGVKNGDVILVNAVAKKVTNVDESLNQVTIDVAFGGTATSGDPVTVPGFQVRTYRKSLTGLVSEVEKSLSEVWCTMEPEVQDYYVINVHSQNRYLKMVDKSSGSAYNQSFPVANSTPAFLTGGLDGTAPTTASHWTPELATLNSLPIRMICLCETSDITIQKSVETYCKGRLDTPIQLTVFPENQDQAQLLVLGSKYQRSDDVFQVNVADWLYVDDPYNQSPNAPDRTIPNVGAVMGAWIRTIDVLGIHYIPSVDAISLIGINGIRNQAIGEVDNINRTIIAQYGVNLIQFINGSGYRIRNFFTPSTATEYLFANGLIMRNYIKISSQDSLQSSENTPNTINRIREDGKAVENFLYRLWYRGSNGNAPEGETFGQQENDDGSLTLPSDHFEVEADHINNPQANINLGERNIRVYFSYPTPAGSIFIDVGILLR